MDKGVKINCPQSVEIGPEVDLARIEGKNVTIYTGCKIFGASTLIMEGTQLGYEGPVTVEDCCIGPNVKLKGGFFQKSVFLDGAEMGSGAQVREGTLLEEESKGAHCVGLKQTILFPFVTLGSLINFCDCLMAGGTGRKNHSEVGSSYIHFNFTPNADKATASLFGDVPRGVLLNQPPIFLGGQGGTVGPIRLGYGTVVAAGSICRRDSLEDGKLIYGKQFAERSVNSYTGMYREVKNRIVNNLIYLGNLLALRQWYLHVRKQFIMGNAMRGLLFQGAEGILESAVRERKKRLGELASKVNESRSLYQKLYPDKSSDLLFKQKEEFAKQWPRLEEALSEMFSFEGDSALRESCLEAVARSLSKEDKNYVNCIQNLSPDDASAATQWLQGIIDQFVEECISHLPSFQA